MFRLRTHIGGRELRCLVGSDHAVTVGSGDDCDFVLREPTVSRHHARLRVQDGTLVVEDLDSRNGVFIGRQRVHGSTELRPGQRLRLGSAVVELTTADLADAELAVAGGAPVEAVVAPPASTLATAPLAQFCMSAVPDLLRALADGIDLTDFAVRLAAAIARCESGMGAEIRRGEGVLSLCGRVEDKVAAGGARAEFTRAGFTLAVSGPAETEPLLQQLAAIGLDLLACTLRGDGAAPVATPPRTSPAATRPYTTSPALAEIYRRAAQVAPSRISVLIEGETGTGKELMARYLHQASGLPAARFVALNCAALPRDLLDAELFGIEAGVATGVTARAGKFEQAHGGTLFLDEIADMAPDTQARLLRVLQEGRVYRIGGREARPAEARVISACNRDLERMVAAGTFRLDLYHRIADWPLRMPPLRERVEDIAGLAAHFLELHCRQRGIGFGGISRAALEAMQAYSWPGNVRELEREMARVALFVNSGEVVDSNMLKPAIAAARTGGSLDGTLAEALAREERRLIQAALRATGGNAVEAARQLAVGKSTLYRRMQQLGIEPQR